MYRLQILTPEEVYYEGDVISTIAPGEAGYLGILTDHTPLIATLKAGFLIITDPHHKKRFFKVEKGFIEVNSNQVAVLVEAIQPTEPVDFISGLD